MFSRKGHDGGEAGRALSHDQMGPVGIFFCILFCAAIVFILDYGVLPPPYHVNAGGVPMIAPIDVKARVAFHYSDPEELNRQREEAAARAPRVYIEDADWTDTILRDLEAMNAIVENANSEAQARDSAEAAHFGQYMDLVQELYRYKEANQGRVLPVERIRLNLNINGKAPIFSDAELGIERNKPEPRQIIRYSPIKGRKGEFKISTVPARDYTSRSTAVDTIKRATWSEGLPWMLQRYISSYLEMHVKSNLKLDKGRTEQSQYDERRKIGSGDIAVRKFDTILEKNQLIRQSALDRLREEYRAYKQSLRPVDRAKHMAGLGAVAGAVLIIFLTFASRVDPGIWRRRRALFMLALLGLTTLGLCRALLLAGFSPALTPFVFVGIVASLAFGQSIALLTLLGLTVLCTFAGIVWEAVPMEGGIPTIVVALLAGGIAAALPAERLRDRWDLLKYGAMGGLMQGLIVAGLSFLGGNVAPEFLEVADVEQVVAQWPSNSIPTVLDSLIALVNGPLCGLLVLGSLPVIESLFKILTNIRLFELADMNQPALKRIQLEAPGTFAHTLQVRFLAEPAAEAIGANTRLVSAGVLYHDLGKTLKPEYFVENSMEAEERHRRLRPSVSALLITAHVKDGVELAREYRLPQQIIDFIPEHHGTTLVSYFYHTAMKNAESEGTALSTHPVQESFFRYPGPKPQSRETALVMLADTVEAASRTLQSPSAARLTTFVHDLVMDKMLDGQLDECGLTFADLAQVEEAFVRVLVTKFHSRIRYPGQENEEIDDTSSIERRSPEPLRPGSGKIHRTA